MYKWAWLLLLPGCSWHAVVVVVVLLLAALAALAPLARTLYQIS